MASLLGSLASLTSYHLLAWGSLVGTQLYQTFVMTKLAYLHLPRPQFMSLQRHVFPAYFAAASVLTVATALTYPAGSLVGLATHRGDGVLLGVSLGMSILNLLVYGPRSIATLTLRNHQETRDSLKLASSATLPRDQLSPAMYLAKRAFSFNHSMSIHLNLIGVIATVLYGLSLSTRVHFV